MKKLQSQPLQALSVAAVLVAAFALFAPPSDARAARGSRSLQIEGVALPSMTRRATELALLAVPDGHVFVVPGLARAATSPLAYRVDVRFDGETVLKTSFSYDPEGACGMVCTLPSGLVAESGALVEVAATMNAGGVLLGYLAY
jgi:hypothetical protein